MKTGTPPYLVLRDLPFTQDILDAGGMVYAVGGFVRDFFIGKESKDLDILVTKVSFEDLIEILRPYGKNDLVGASFGIIKHKPNGSDEDIDIAFPRKEVKNGSGYQGFSVVSDPFLPIEDDLRRRDLAMNAMAMDVHGNLIDPFSGMKDIKNKVINITDENTFFDDPLRLLRIVSFSARFNFTIEPKTMALIQANAHLIKEITGERILIELEKITAKGNPRTGIELLVSTGLFKHIFGFDFRGEMYSIGYVKTLGRFIFELMKGNNVSAQKIYLERLRGDSDTGKEILAYEKLEKGLDVSDTLQRKLAFFNALNTSPRVLEFGQVPDEMQEFLKAFKSGKYPRNLKELNVNGNDLMGVGLKGIEVGEMFNNILSQVLNDTLKNDHKVIMDYVVSLRMKKLS